MMKPHILIIPEHADGALSPLTHELIACARHLNSRLSPQREIKLILCPDAGADAADAAARTGVDVIAVGTGAGLKTPLPVYKLLSRDLLLEFNPELILLAHTVSGLEIAPALAVRLDAACITGVEKIVLSKNRISCDRLIMGGKITARLSSNAPILVCTLQPGLYDAGPPPIGESRRDIIHRRVPEADPSYAFLGVSRCRADISRLEGADVIIAAGNGVREKERIGLIRELAGLFPRSAVAGSRPVCDRRWLEYHQQVGVTGAVVKPKLYMACGISGASQHIAGMKQSQFIVSVNTDPRAAICSFSDICIIEDLSVFIPELIETIRS